MRPLPRYVLAIMAAFVAFELWIPLLALVVRALVGPTAPTAVQAIVPLFGIAVPAVVALALSDYLADRRGLVRPYQPKRRVSLGDSDEEADLGEEEELSEGPDDQDLGEEGFEEAVEREPEGKDAEEEEVKEAAEAAGREATPTGREAPQVGRGREATPAGGEASQVGREAADQGAGDVVETRAEAEQAPLSSGSAGEDGRVQDHDGNTSGRRPHHRRGR